MVDIGGGSTEIVICEEGNIIMAESIPFGSLNMLPGKTKRVLPDRLEYKRIKRLIKKELEKIEGMKELKYPVVVGVGGTIRATARLNNEAFNLPDNNKEIPAKNIKNLIRYLISDETRSLDLILRVAPDRVRTLVYGMTILWIIIRTFGCEKLLVSSLGVREGYLLSKLLAGMKIEGRIPEIHELSGNIGLEQFPEVDVELPEIQEKFASLIRNT